MALLLLPFAIVGIAVNWIPMVLVWLLGRASGRTRGQGHDPPDGGDRALRDHVGMTAWGANELFGLEGVGGLLLLMPIYLFAVIVLSERLALIWKSVRTWIRQGRVGNPQERIMADRQQVVDTVTDAL